MRYCSAMKCSALSLACSVIAAAALAAQSPARATSGLTAVEGIKVGHHTLTERPTGCAVILVDGDAVGGVSQRGGAPGTLEISGTVDEESGGFAGVAHLAQVGRIRKGRTDFVVIPEPLNVDRICIGHRGVYWFEVTARGRIGHGSMPFLGVSAIDGMGRLLQTIRDELMPALAARKTAVPVVPAGARHATINVNGIEGGQPIDGIQTPCVADVCRAVFDRRFLIEEGFEAARDEIAALVAAAAGKAAGVRFELRDLMVVHPTRTPDDSPVIGALDRSIRRVLGKPAALIASPGTYDHKHVARIADVPHCVAYGPGELELAHQPDEYCRIEDLVNATKVLALATLDLMGVGR